jgi:hypothetical protein
MTWGNWFTTLGTGALVAAPHFIPFIPQPFGIAISAAVGIGSAIWHLYTYP